MPWLPSEVRLVGAGFTVAAIDGFMHGDRRPGTVAAADDAAGTGGAYLAAIESAGSIG